MSWASDDLASLHVAPGRVFAGYGQGILRSWNPETAENEVDYRGTRLVNLAVLPGVDSLRWRTGDVVLLTKWTPSGGGTGTYWIAGSPLVPSAGTVDSRVTLHGGELVIVAENGLSVDGGSAIRARYASGNVALLYGRTVSQTTGGAGHGLLVRRDVPTGTDGGVLFHAGVNADGSTSISAGAQVGSTSYPVNSIALLGQSPNIIGTSSSRIRVGSDYQFIAASNSVFVFTDLTTSQSANVYMFEGGALARVTSSSRYKEEIQDASLSAEAVLKLRPRTWRDKSDNGEPEAPPETNPGEAAPPAPSRRKSPKAHKRKRHVGLIAEEVDALGLTELVSYDKEGRPDAVAYDRVAVALIDVVKSLTERVANLEQRLLETESRLDAV